MVSPAASPPNSVSKAPVSKPPVSKAPVALSRRRSAFWLSRWHISPQQAYLWGLGLGSFTLGLVNGALVISTGIGVLAYRQLVQLSPAQQQALRQRIQSAVPLPRSLGKQAIVLSVMLGASTYTVTSLWQSTHSLLMPLVLTGQTALTFFVVVALLRSPGSSTGEDHPTKRADANAIPAAKAARTRSNVQAVSQTLEAPGAQTVPTVATSSNTKTERFEQALGHLTHADPLQRLIAVRQLVRLVHQASPGETYIAGAEVSMQAHLIDCFHVMLAHEPEPVVRSAVREGLTLLRQPATQANQLPAGSAPLPDLAVAAPDPWFDQPSGTPEALSSPLEAPAQVVPPAKRTVEYVEYLDI